MKKLTSLPYFSLSLNFQFSVESIKKGIPEMSIPALSL